MPILRDDAIRLNERLLLWFKECTPKILVVTDGLNYSPADAFGLTEFVSTLRTSTIHGMTPIVITARFSPGGALSFDAVNRHIDNYKFTDPTHGVLKSRYDVVFMLGINGQFAPGLSDEPGALDAMTAFMQAGGGVFATGDHEDLGAGLCKDVPRVRNMRLWTTGVPSAGGTDRLTTNLPGRSDVPGSNDTYEFNDQSDRFPQRLYVNFRTEAGGADAPHPLLAVPASARAVEVFPDHPHEGECVVPADLSTKLADGATDEWPNAPASGRVSPELVAMTMSHGDSFPGKASVVPRSFIAICAYDGQRANVGRVVTDATWHHFVNINIKPGMAAIAGRDLTDIKQYYANLGNWLMPKNVRRCRRFPWILQELVRYPLYEELLPLPRKQWDGPRLRDVGMALEQSLRSHRPKAEVDALIDDALEEADMTGALRGLDTLKGMVNGLSARDAGLAAIGALTLMTAERYNEIADERDLDGERVFAEIGKAASQEGVKLFVADAQQRLKKIADLARSVKL
jgi:hypothetical protein